MTTGNDPREGAFSALDKVALQIFTARIANAWSGRSGDRDAIESYRKAKSFLDVRQRIQAGELQAEITRPTGPQLADCCAPNLPATHPLNLVAREHRDRRTGKATPGDLARVQRIARWLLEHPQPAGATDDQAKALHLAFVKTFPELGWGQSQVDLARKIFPHYLPKASA